MNRTTRWAAGLGAAACLLTSACDAFTTGGSHLPAPQQANHAGKSTYQQAVAFAKCMRAHGDPSWPDPGPQGAFPNDNGSLDKSSPQYKKAHTACRELEPGGPDPAVFQQDYKKELKYSACMRQHGITNFPDPKMDQHGVGITVDGRKVDVKSPQFAAADRACRHFEPAGGR